MKKAFDARQMMAIQLSERTMSVLSILGSLFIITTFIRWQYFRKPINRLVFYACFGNMMANVATLIATSALPTDTRRFSSLCEFQGVFIQWFLMADTLWVFCMAFNVLLVFFHGYNSAQLRHLEKWYMVFCYGLPGTIALIYLILNHAGPQRVIGPATIWCWVTSEAEWMRIAFFYAPVWVVVCSTLAIYIVTGREIFKKRAELREFSRKMAVDLEANNVLTNPFTTVELGNITVETEMKVETHYSRELDPEVPAPVHCAVSRCSFSSTNQLSDLPEVPPPSPPIASHLSRLSWDICSAHPSTAPISRPEEAAHIGYSATAFSTNQQTRLEQDRVRSMSLSDHNSLTCRKVAIEGDAAAWGYFKVAFLMFAALFIVWVPSTINRLEQFVHKETSIFGLNLASALVLPLQGFWNALIYVSTTWPECNRAFAETLDALSRIYQTKRRIRFSRKSNRISAASDTQAFGAPVPLSYVESTSELQLHLQSHVPNAEYGHHAIPLEG